MQKAWWRATAACVPLFATFAWLACGPGDLTALRKGLPAPPPDACAAVGVNDPPDAADDEPNLTIVFALSDLRMDVGALSSNLPSPGGLNLDRTCTCPDRDSCVRPEGAPQACDTDSNRDNAAALLFTGGAQPLSPVVGLIRNGLKDGRFSILLEVASWNGKPDDPRVRLAIMFATGITQAPDAGSSAKPKHDGTDVWDVDTSSITTGPTPGTECATGPCIAKVFSEAAYVSGGQLVALGLDAPIGVNVSGPRFVVDLADAVAFGRLGRRDGETFYRLEGEVAGRWSAAALLTNLGRLKFETDVVTVSLCGNDTYERIKKSVCASVDLSLNGDPTSACDALSTALSFTAVQAHLGRVAAPSGLTSDCPDWTDRCN